jgi:hypothetical protein
MTSLHSALADGDLHQPFRFAQPTDPGAGFPNEYWLDTSSVPYGLKRRNGSDTAWVYIAGVPAGVTGATRFEPLTNGDAAFPEVVFAEGDIVMVEVPG